MSNCKLKYLCDPKKNKECKKRNCFIHGGKCRNTDNKNYAVIGDLLPFQSFLMNYILDDKNKDKSPEDALEDYYKYKQEKYKL